MSDGLVKILDGNIFVVSDGAGDIEASLTDPTGLFAFDTRFLSKWVLTVDGKRLNALSTDDLQYFEARFFLVPGTGTVYVDADLSVIRQRSVSHGFHEQLTLINHRSEPVTLDVRIDAASDFADLFEVKDALKKKGSYSPRVEDDCLVLEYHRQTFVRETWIGADTPAEIDVGGLRFEVRLGPHQRWSTEIRVVAGHPALPIHPKGMIRRSGHRTTRAEAMARDLEAWIAAAPRLECDSDSLRATYPRSLVDLAAL
ncbi:MAG TPA: glycogen debranching N-terminal domain-containing protein, partial [Acidimicrobiales bacterium]|nr:glycogen debranching N-terminal domain-containing protein [Acidimicrobiales bacterium]